MSKYVIHPPKSPSDLKLEKGHHEIDVLDVSVGVITEATPYLKFLDWAHRIQGQLTEEQRETLSFRPILDEDGYDVNGAQIEAFYQVPNPAFVEFAEPETWYETKFTYYGGPGHEYQFEKEIYEVKVYGILNKDTDKPSYLVPAIHSSVEWAVFEKHYSARNGKKIWRTLEEAEAWIDEQVARKAKDAKREAKRLIAQANKVLEGLK